MSPANPTDDTYLLTLSCPDTRGIVNAVSGFLVERDCNILDSAQFGDTATGLFAMRLHFAAEGSVHDVARLDADFADLGTRYGMSWRLRSASYRPRVLILVSREDHCLHDLLYRYDVGELRIDIPAIVSNHRSAERLASGHDIPYLHWPVAAGERERWDDALLELVDDKAIDFVVLARYMQILSGRVCEALPARIINIHHSFLPGFKGARPYAQAYDRGVKLIGATAHYVTTDLDEGPIIEQDVMRVDHSMPPDELAAIGRDVEKVVLARAVRYQAEQRVVLNGAKTVVFP